jgi:hypothetical protein
LSDSTGYGPWLFAVGGLIFVGILIIFGIRSCSRQDSLSHAENTPVTMSQEGIISHSWAKVRMCPGSFNGPCPRGGGFRQWLHVSLRNQSSQMHTVILCGAEVRTKNDPPSSIGAACFRLTLKPGSKLHKVISRMFSLLGQTTGFQVVHKPTIVGIDAHPIQPVGTCADDGTQWFCTYSGQATNGY